MWGFCKIDKQQREAHYANNYRRSRELDFSVVCGCWCPEKLLTCTFSSIYFNVKDTRPLLVVHINKGKVGVPFLVAQHLSSQQMFCRSVKWFSVFDACYVLNLDRRQDRWAHVQQQLSRAKLETFLRPPAKVTRVSGVDGQALDVEALHRNGLVTDVGYQRFLLPLEEKLFGMDLTPGAIGCALGHRKIWETVVEKRHQCALILEDDVEFHHKFPRLLREVWPRVPSDWGIVHLGGLDLLASGKPPRPFVDVGVRHAYSGHRELTAYVLHHAAAKRCLEHTLPMTWQVDTHICSVVTEDPAAQDSYISDPMTYVFQPSLAIQITSFGTDVQKRPSDNPPLEDAARRMREFVGGGTSVR
ncbi:glycosyltransferase family-like protein [Trypanosoma brucei gambiense DAL972]|uniref:Glycosyltransferase family-like protein n=3 Tax=Trypanozoon TaxID=39700 RepID=D0A6N3_TRYB9|nr:glycosyltransferase family-like protein [Trypanosoma brucei gambiense DAL972]CBH17334.1 glycosyltransferase family-like protein [Trypanosoma brucei gambiense DAL972]|eukprot:XP_011779598.1 glycosyltransferase family-like protein [Trypanosoma brucei gambiense DAL972]